MRIRFGTCVLDGDARLLVRDGAVVHLSPKALDTLLVLAAERPRAVGKRELLERVWPDTFVTDASLARTVHEIRDALGDANASVVRTVHGHGYAFAAEVLDDGLVPPSVAAAPEIRGWIYANGRTVAVTAEEMVIGRDPVAALALDSSHVSWHHARLRASATAVVIEDLGSKNGTIVGGERLDAARVLRDGDEILVGQTRLVFRSAERPSTETLV
ncbi:MAG: FHA domain-containing protein [Vicinamibacterales bacterium]